MNQIITNKAKSKSIMRKDLHKRRNRLVTRAVFLALCAVLFALPAKAQVSTGDNYQVYMKEGNSQVARGATNVKFYDDHGPSYASDGNTNYWDRWYVVNKHYTYVFRPKTAGDKVKVTFKKFHAYEWSDTEPNNCHDIGEFSLRINDDVLKVYNSDGAIAANLIAELTGTVAEEFTFMADGPMTFEFISNEQYREEGWGAEVTAVTTMSVQAPLIRRSTCSDDILLIPTVPGATMYYTTDGTTPTTSSTTYTAPIEWPAGNNITIKAIAVLDGNSSAVTTKTFNNATDRMPTMDGKEPTIERVAGTNTVRITCPSVPTGMNETFYVVYTTNNTEPTATNPNGTKVFFVPGSSYEYPTSLGITVHSNIYEFECNTPGTVVRAKTFAYSCSNLVSDEGTALTITTVYVDAPTISFTTTNSPNQGDGQATIGNIMTGATVHYTTDGSAPNASSPTYSSSTPISVTPGQTVQVIAMAGTGYENSPVVSATYIPAGGNGTYGGIVLLDDREDHSWSYYSMDSPDNPIHSLNPADVKITYKGFGENTMTTTNTNATGLVAADFNANVASNQVAVNVGSETENQFIYLKTLEKDGDSYPYTMIPNPFQVRPTYSSRGEGNGETIVNRDGTANVVSGGVGTSQYIPMYNWYCDYGFKSEYIIPASYFTNAGLNSGDNLTSITIYRANTGSWTAKNLTIKLKNTTTSSYSNTNFLGNDGTTVYTNSSYSATSQSSYTFSFSAPFEYTGGSLIVQISSENGGTASTSSTASTWYGINGTTNYQANYTNGSSSGSATTGTRQSFLPNTSFGYTSGGGGGGLGDCDYSEDFEGVTGTSGYSAAGSLPTGWNFIWNGTSAYAPHVYLNSASTPGPPSTGNYLGFYASGSESEYSYAIMPAFAAGEAANHISFKYKFESASSGTLTYGVIDGTDASTYTILGTISSPSTNPGTVDEALNVSQTAGKRIAFRWYKTGTWYTCGIDDICVSVESAGSSSDYRGFYAWKVKRLGGGLTIKSKDGSTTYGQNTMIPAETEVQFITSNEDGNEVEFEALWAKAWVTTTTSTSGLNPNVSYERNFMVLSSNPGSTSSTTQWPTSSSTTNTDGANLPIYQYSSSYPYSLTQQIYTPAQIGSAGTITQLAFNVSTAQNSNRTLLIYLSAKSSDYNTIPQTTNSNNQTVYRTIPINVSSDLVYSGTVNFNATGWKTITLDTPFEYDGTSNLVLTVMDNTNSTRSMVFYTYSSGGTRAAYFSNGSAVDLGQYYYYVDGTSTYNNQIQFVKAISNLAGISVPLTMTTYNPDGSGGSSSVSISNEIRAGADLKFENIKMNAVPLLSAEGHDLVVGRGVEAASTGGITASYVRGLSNNAASPNYKIRLESGTYERVSMVDGYYQHESNITVSGTPKVWLTLGSDYDRASETYKGNIQITNKLNVTTAVAVGRGAIIGSTSMIGQETFKTWMKSGKVGSNHSMNNFYADFTQTLYMGSHGTPTYSGYRKLFIEGGEISGVAGGMDKCYTNTTTNTHTKTLTIRMTDGHIRSCIHGGAAQVPAGGDKEIIVTGGTVTGWIGAGCNGTSNNGGQTYGEGFVYFGGDAVLGGEGSSNLTNGLAGGNLFGAGNGRLTATTSGEMAFGTNVVVADQCDIEHDVYGGGNYGYAEVKANVYVLGGTVHGSVYGGANQKKGAVVNVTQQGGTIEGNIYGGSNIEGSVGGLSTINISGGTVNNVFGGGLGINTDMTAGTVINISGGTINNNVYGGGQLGKVSEGNTNVNISDGTMKEVYGAGMGESGNTADVNGQTYVNIMGGTMTNVYGGGQAGNVIAETPASAAQTLTYDFEDGSLPAGWTIRDADGDGDQWVVGSNEDFLYANGGSYYLVSSYNASQAVNNWVISQKIPLGGTISFYARRAATDYTDKFRVYVSTTGTNINDFTPVTAEITPTATYTQYSYTIGTAGNKGYVAICHIADADQYALFLDNITITTPAVEAVLYDVASQVTIEGGIVNENIFGGGKMGKTDGDVVVNMFGGNVKGSVFGGALGEQGSVFVGGQKTVNMTGGHVFGNLYGGSRFANDALTREGYDESEQATTCEINMSAGKIDQNLYGAGYLGHTYGSINVYLGAEAINRAPNHTPVDPNINYTRDGGLNIEGSIYAGSDWGDFTGGSFGASTVSGQSNVYVDGTGYNTTSNSTSAANYMKAGVAIFGCGTSCDAGSTGRNLIVRNYGTAVADAGNVANPYSNTTRQYFSIQRFKDVTFDNAHLLFTGQGKVNSLNVTEKYGLYEDEVVHLTNGSTMMTNVTCTQMKSFQSVTCPDVYAASPVFTPVAINGLGSTGGATDNKIRVNGGSYIEVKYVPEGGSTTQNFDFEDGALPSGWTKEGNNTWNVGNGDGNTGDPAGTHGGNYNALITHGTSGNITYLVTSSFNLGEATSATLDFWYINRKWSNDIDVLGVCYRVNGGAWTELWSTTTNHESWTEQSVTLTGLDDNYQIGFKFTDGYGYGVGLDDINLSIVMDPQDAKLYRELKGWSHMMSSINDDEATCAYARPKQSQEPGNIIPSSEDNPNDGGFVSYDGIYNQYTAAGALVSVGNSEQIRYENHTPNMRDDSKYFRIWRYGGNHINIPAVFDAHATGTAGYRTVDVTVTLPPFRSGSHYYRFETTGEDVLYLTTEYGSDVMAYNAACYNTTLDSDGIHGTPVSNGYMYYNNGQILSQTIGSCPGKTDIDNNPNVNFGLVIMPDNTMVNGTNYIICDASETYLAGLQQPFTCHDNTMAPQMTFRLTYSNELSSNMTWDPMKVKLVQCDASGHITDYVTVELTVVTSTTITQDFHTDVYAIMDQHGSLKDTYTAKLILPRFDVLTAGANSTFTVTGVSFVPDVLITPDHTAVDTIPISSDGLLFHEDNFGLAIDAADTYDNSNVWYSLGDRIDIVNPNGKVIGMNSGRNEVGIDITLFYTSRPEGVEIENESHMGQVIINVAFDNYLYGTGANHTGTLRIIVDVYRRGEGDNFYVDGIDGKDETGYGRRPDKPAATVNYIFNRCNYTPGGNIFVVNTVTVDRAETWNGARFNSVNMYRYPGMHLMSDNTYGTHENNAEFTGKLVEVTNELTMRGIVMDGMYAEANLLEPYDPEHPDQHYQHIYPSDHGCDFNGESVAPLINVADGGRINLKDGVVLKNNDNTSNANYGGAMSIEYGGTARMNYDAKIANNYNVKGGGVWVDGSLIVSDMVEIFGNKVNPTANTKSNVWLTNATEEQAKANVHYKVVQIGTSSTTDEYGPLYLSGEAKKIGVGKDDWDHSIDGYMPVVYSEDGTEEEYLHEDGGFDTYAALRDGVFIHDDNKFELEEYPVDWHYLYWLSTWVTFQDHVPTLEEGGWNYTDEYIASHADAHREIIINTKNQLAWIISLVNGEHDQPRNDFHNKTVVINNDIDMSEHIWVPIGDATTNFKGTLQGNGHVISGLKSSLVRDNMGMFGITDGATIKDAVVVGNFNGDAANLGTVVGTMKGGVLKNVESAGTLEGKTHTENVGGLVGKQQSGTVHSSFALNTVSGATNNTVVGGLVGTNGGDLYNSYANVTLDSDNTSTKLGGLVGINSTGCHVGNCYVINPIGAAFAFDNQGTIEYCYGAKPAEGETVTYVENGTQPAGHGTYDVVKTRKAIGYMYDDNTVEALTSDTTYIRSKVFYDVQITEWPGLLSTLNQWVTKMNGSTSTLSTLKPFTVWYRPTSSNINGDLPILGFPKDNCMANNNDERGKFLWYSAFNYNTAAGAIDNGLDKLLTKYNENSVDMFLYGNAVGVIGGTANNNLFINEDAVLTQTATSGTCSEIDATVGITFDNSCRKAIDYFGNRLYYDWHFLSSPLSNAPMGITYKGGAPTGFGGAVNIDEMVNNYLPNGLPMGAGYSEGVKWDLFSYYEPEYHWINLKRRGDDHWHREGPHSNIEYVSGQVNIVNGEAVPLGASQNETIFVPGKGYMMAISQDSYLNNTGMLNNSDVTIRLTNEEELDEPYNKGWNLVGNPFQAYINLANIAEGSRTYYIYDADLKDYIPVTAGQSKNPDIPSLLIHPHQGFFMYTASTTDFTFDYSLADTTKQETSYYRGFEGQLDYPLVNLFAENERGNRDLTVIEFNRPELGGATKVKGIHNSNFEVAASLNGLDYGILFTPEGTAKVPVHFKTESSGTYTFSWRMHNGNFTSLRLVDNKTGVNYDMLANDHYTFESSVDDYASRFYITYVCTGMDEEYVDDDDSFAYYDGSEWVINGKGLLDVIDETGRVLLEKRLNNEQNRVNLNGFAKGVYLLRVIDNKVVRTQKIIVM